MLNKFSLRFDDLTYEKRIKELNNRLNSKRYRIVKLIYNTKYWQIEIPDGLNEVVAELESIKYIDLELEEENTINVEDCDTDFEIITKMRKYLWNV